MREKLHHTYLSSLPALFLLVIVLLAGCDAPPTNTLPTATATSTLSPLGNSTPKGPAPTELTATAQATPISTVCPNTNAVPASTHGWTMYKDKQYPFQFSIPTGWKAGSFTSSSGDGSSSYYSVLLLPPGSTAQFSEEGALSTPENFTLNITLSGPIPSLSKDASWTPETAKVSMNHTQITVYDRVSPGCGEVDHETDGATLGHFTYDFYMVSTSAKARGDTALFLGVVQSFVYTG